MATAVGSELTIQSASAPFTEYVYQPQGSALTFEKAAAPYVENIYTPAASQLTVQSTAPALQYLAGSGLTLQSGAPVIQQFGGIFPVGSQLTLAMPSFMDVGNDYIPDGSDVTAESGAATTVLPAGSGLTAQSGTASLAELLFPVGSQMQAQTTLVTGLRLFPLGSELALEKTLSIVTIVLIYPEGYTGDVLLLRDGTLTMPGTRTVTLTIPATRAASLDTAS